MTTIALVFVKLKNILNIFILINSCLSKTLIIACPSCSYIFIISCSFSLFNKIHSPFR